MPTKQRHIHKKSFFFRGLLDSTANLEDQMKAENDVAFMFEQAEDPHDEEIFEEKNQVSDKKTKEEEKSPEVKQTKKSSDFREEKEYLTEHELELTRKKDFRTNRHANFFKGREKEAVHKANRKVGKKQTSHTPISHMSLTMEKFTRR